VITGFNTDVEHGGVVYHVQTEDKGLKSPLILSLVYVGGTIIASKRTPYDDLIAAGFDEDKLAERLQRQHRLICAAIHSGRIEDLKRQTEREAAMRSKSTQQEEPEEAQAQPPVEAPPPVETPPPVEAPPPVESPPAEEFIIYHGFDHDAPVAPPMPTAPAAPVIEELPAPAPDPVASLPQYNPVDHVDYSRVVDYGGNFANPDDLQITLLEEKKFVAGEFVKINLHVGRGPKGLQSVPNVAISLKVLGSSFRPLIFSGKTGGDGTAIFYAMLPYFTSGRAAILISATLKGERTELRRVIHQA